MKRQMFSAASLAALLLAGSAMAQTAVTATSDLNVRAGPGPQYPVIGYIAANAGADLLGCADGSKWCTVAFDGGEGWVYSDYLVSDFGGTRVIVTERPAEAVPVVTYEAPVNSGDGAGAIAGATTGAVAGALIGGPIGAAVGGVAGAATGGIAEGALSEPPAPEVRRYIADNRVDPVYLDGEVVVGAGIPDTVEIREIPDYDYQYVYVNGQPVLVEPESRRIVYVVRD